MTHDEVVIFYGSATKAAKALGISRAAISLWKVYGYIPELRQWQIQALTKNKLKVDQQIKTPSTAFDSSINKQGQK